jgi:hypothetical protein
MPLSDLAMTTALMSSSVSSDGTPSTAHSTMSRWVRMASSTSKAEMFSPRRRIVSFRRPSKKTLPSASMETRSPVWNQKLRMASEVASGMPW